MGLSSASPDGAGVRSRPSWKPRTRRSPPWTTFRWPPDAKMPWSSVPEPRLRRHGSRAITVRASPLRPPYASPEASSVAVRV